MGLTTTLTPVLFAWFLAQPGPAPGRPMPVQPPGRTTTLPPAATPGPGAPPGARTPSIQQPTPPPSGAVSPEVGGSALLTQPPQGERLVPTCTHDPNPGDVLRLESLAMEVSIGQDRVRLRRKLTFSPTTAWKPVCDHVFFLGEPETAWTSGAKTQVWFTQPPRPRQEVPVVIRKGTRELKSFGSGNGTTPDEGPPPDLVGAELTLAPLPGNPTDHRLVLELEQESVVFPEAGEDGLTSLNFPLTHLVRYTPSKSLQLTVQIEFSGSWHFHGATIPETGHLENRVTWEMPGVPDLDLKILFSGEPPTEPEPGPQAPEETLGEKILRWVLLGSVLAVILGVLLLALWGRRRADRDHRRRGSRGDHPRSPDKPGSASGPA